MLPQDFSRRELMELYGSGQSVSIHWAFHYPFIQRSSMLAATKHPGQGACDSPRWWVEDREEFCRGMVGRQQTGASTHALLALQARRGCDRERADRAERRPSMEITSDQWWKIQWRQELLLGTKSHGACKRATARMYTVRLMCQPAQNAFVHFVLKEWSSQRA